MSRLIIFLLLLLGLGALSAPNHGSHAYTAVTAKALKPRQNMTIPGHNHMIPDEMDVFVRDMWIFKEYGCSLQPEALTTICYFDHPPVRQDITEGQFGLPLTLTMKISDVNTCEPVVNTYVDIWHANATGWYSNVLYPPILEDSTKKDPFRDNELPTTALRGRYLVDENGFVTFKTIFPGKLFPPLLQEAPHVNFIVHRQGIASNSSGLPAQPEDLPHALEHLEVVHSGKVFFDDALVALVNTYEPYKGYWTQKAVIKSLWFYPNLTNIGNANDANYRAEYANGTDVKGKNLDPVAWYRFQGGIWAYVGIGVDNSTTHDVWAWDGEFDVTMPGPEW